MIAFITILFPSIIGMKVYENLVEEKANKELIIIYLKLVLATNSIMFFIFYLINNYDGNIVNYINEHSFFSFKYIIISIIINYLLGIIMSVFKKGFSFKIESIKKNEKKSTKKTVRKSKKSN